ncbi:DUF87 domain-containing protein [bacterium]|nr:DUF87 domain-containing protein [bacterium]
MIDYEKLGVFYLGRELDPKTRARTETPYLYDAKDLTTHAIVIGMTGSGKTGLCVTLLEEAAIDGIPAIAIDPKGDIANLMLLFPNLAPADFQPWIDPAEAGRQGKTTEQYATETSDRWKKGLADWEQPVERINKVLSAADIAIYTPGSNAGHPISVVRSFSAPSASVLNDGDAYRQRINSAVAGLLALLGIAGDSLESREHILISTIIDLAWKAGQDVQIASLLRQIQQPPFDKVGFLDLESFFPSAERFALVTRLNNLFASPAFAGWMEGEPLDIGKLLYTAQGKPRVSIMSIAHLSDSERMFFVTILLNEIIAWMRSQPGTSSLRALLYMDEIFGYFPPTANPPSKTPMLTLLKQARAYGLGCVLATQNPVDLDYKGMANTGTWFLGRLQTDRDKQRVLDGLEGASAAAGFHFDRATIDSTLSGLAGRTFLVNNVHEDKPVLIETRFALSYLRGPMTREQIARLMKDKVSSSAPTANSPSGETSAVGINHAAVSGDRPMIPPGIEEFFLPVAGSPENASLIYRPALIGVGQAHYANARLGIDLWENIFILNVFAQEIPHPAWEGSKLGREIEVDLIKHPTAGIRFAPLLSELSAPKNFAGWAGELKQYLYRYLYLVLFKAKQAKINSSAKETEGEFKIRIKQIMTESRDREIEKIRTKYGPKLERLQERIRKAQQRVEKEKSQANNSIIQAILSLGSSVLGAIFGRKTMSVTNVGRASTSVRSAGQAMQQRGDVTRAEDDLLAIEEDFHKLEEEVESAVNEIKDEFGNAENDIEKFTLRPKKSDLTVSKIALVWTPWKVDAVGLATPAFMFDGVPQGSPADDQADA